MERSRGRFQTCPYITHLAAPIKGRNNSLKFLNIYLGLTPSEIYVTLLFSYRSFDLI